MFTIPGPLPLTYTLNPGESLSISSKTGSSQYDCAFGGLGFRYSNNTDNPIIRQLADNQRQRVDQAQEAGEQTLTSWWIRAQSSMHGGGGEIHFEPPFPYPTDRIRFDQSKNVDVWTPGSVKLLPASRSLTGTAPDGDLCGLSTATGADALAYRSGSTVKMIVPGGNPVPVNICTNGDFETDTSGWHLDGSPHPLSFTSSTDHASVGTHSGKAAWDVGNTYYPSVIYNFATTPGQVYTIACDVYVPVGHPDVQIFGFNVPAPYTFGPATGVKGAWARLVHRFTATGPLHGLAVGPQGAVPAGQLCYIDAAVINVGSTAGDWNPAAPPGDATTTISPGAAVTSLATDGTRLFMTAGTKCYRADAVSAFAPVEIYSGLAGAKCRLAWVHDRLMLADSNKIYQLDGNKSSTSVLGAGELVFTHPLAGYAWDGFTTSPAAVVAFGWDGSQSTLTQFTLTNTAGGIPVIAPAGVLAEIPHGERLLACRNTLGAFLAMVTNSGVRVGAFEPYRGALTVGPLSVKQTLLGSVAVQDRFIYTAAALAPDEPGLIRVDMGIQTDQAGRYGWAYDRIGPVDNPTPPTGPGEVAVLPATGRLAYWDAQGLYLSDPALQITRTGWVRTARIRFGLTEPKLFKQGTVKMGTGNGSISIKSTDDAGNTLNLASFYAQAEGDFRLGAGPHEWIQLTFTLSAASELRAWQVKALPGTPREELIKVVVSCADRESSRTGQEYNRPRTAEKRRDDLMALASVGDELVFQEFQQTKTVSLNVVIEQCVFKQGGRPTNTSFTGGEITVTMRTV
jgi:hypothetical protein